LTKDAIYSTSIVSGSIVLVVNFRDGAIALDVAWGVARGIDRGNVLLATADGRLYTTVAALVDLYDGVQAGTLPPSPSPTPFDADGESQGSQEGQGSALTTGLIATGAALMAVSCCIIVVAVKLGKGSSSAKRDVHWITDPKGDDDAFSIVHDTEEPEEYIELESRPPIGPREEEGRAAAVSRLRMHKRALEGSAGAHGDERTQIMLTDLRWDDHVDTYFDSDALSSFLGPESRGSVMNLWGNNLDATETDSPRREPRMENDTMETRAPSQLTIGTDGDTGSPLSPLAGSELQYFDMALGSAIPVESMSDDEDTVLQVRSKKRVRFEDTCKA